ncbi:hypothetical protein TSAR_008511 [Trichomalopsis sarcophagae]|uniref:Uncharacterized protein n=1 Tax=Trichomalopsis sarcophagae TaxID=543379 RepID=A0A232EPN7_9HYME|nr:hypothetical protein TSAR_008511 [Trichomalopsis sarcophagae]
MSSASLFLYVYKNVHGCREKLEKHVKIQEKSVIVKKVKEVDDDYEPHSQIKSQHISDCPELLFDVIMPQSQIIANWNDKKLTTGWQNILRQAIWDAQQLPSAFSFPNNWITNDTQLKISGACSEAHCKSKIFAEGKRRDEAKKVLITMLPSEYREQHLANLSIDYEPPHLNTTVTHRKLREEAVNEHLGYNPLNIYYWSEAQIEVWNLLHKQQLPLSFDTTGSLVRRFSFYKGMDKSKALFYYVLVVGFKQKIIPLLQALLLSHHVPIIVDVFQRWIESGARIPREITTDGSPTLQNAVCLAFNNMTFKNYNLHCYELLLNKKEIEVPKCFYRLDVNHLIHTARKDWTCFAKADLTIIDFYVRCIGYLTQVESLQQFENVVESIIIVSNSVSMEKESLCCQKKESLLQLFKTYEQVLNKFATDSGQEEFATINENASKEPDHNTIDNSLVLYINSLFEKVINLCPQNTDLTVQPNFYYCSEFTKPFKILCYTFTTWTNVMKRIFMSPNNVGTSCRSETYNKDRKQAVPRPIIIPKFLLKERTKIAATTKFVFTRTKSIKKNEKISAHDNMLDLDLEKLVISNGTKTETLFPDQVDHELPAPTDVQDVQFNSTVVYGDIQTNELFDDLNLSQIPTANSDQHFHSTLIYNGIETKECYQDLKKLQTPAVHDLKHQVTDTCSSTKSNEETSKSILEPSDISIQKHDLKDLFKKLLNAINERKLILNETFPNENSEDNKEIKTKWKLYDSLATTSQEILSPAENIALILFVQM